MILLKMIREWRIWRIVRRTVKKHSKQLEAINFYVDWVGRLYSIIDIPEDIMNLPLHSKQDYDKRNLMIDSYIKSNLKDVTALLTELQLADLIAYPLNYEIFENTNSILFILSPQRYYTKPFRVALYFIALGLAMTGVYMLVEYILTLF